MSDDFSDDIAERADEIEALSAIFEGSMAVNSDDNSVSQWKLPWQILPTDSIFQTNILFLMHTCTTLRQSSNPVCGSWKNQASLLWAKQHRA